MIVLFCLENDDYFFLLKKWLNFYSCDYIEIDLDKLTYSNFQARFKNNESSIHLNLSDGFSIDLQSVSLFFYRSGWPQINKLEQSNFDIDVANDYFYMEQNSLLNYVFSSIQSKTIGWIKHSPLNKLHQNSMALKAGLRIPNQLLTDSRDKVKSFFGKCNFISKAIQENIFEESIKYFFIQRVTKVKLEELPDYFELSLFQEYISKEIELRCFYLNGESYCISSSGHTENVDIRDNINSQYHTKFKLSKVNENKIQKLMNALGLLAGSLDLIISKEGHLYFLEINTQGQYNAMSYFGNYNIDKKLAEFSVEKEQELLMKTV